MDINRVRHSKWLPNFVWKTCTSGRCIVRDDVWYYYFVFSRSSGTWIQWRSRFLAKEAAHDIHSKDVKTGFLTQPVIGLLKPVIYRLPDYVMSHVAWLIVGCRPNVSIWGTLHSNTGRNRSRQMRLCLVERCDRSWFWQLVVDLQHGPVFTKCVWLSLIHISEPTRPY